MVEKTFYDIQLDIKEYSQKIKIFLQKKKEKHQ